MEEPCVMAGEGAVAFGEAGGAEAEAIVVAREARQLADRFTPGAVAVVFRDMAGRLPAITQALESQNLPFDVDVVEAVCSTPLGSSLADLLVGMTGPGDPRALTAFLVTPYAGVDRDVREQLDAAWRGRRPASARELAQGVAVVAPDTGHLLVRALLLTEGGIDAVSLAEWKRLLDSLLCRRFGSIPEAGDTAFARDASAHRAAFEAVSAMVEARDEAVSARDVLAALREARTAARTYERVGHVQLVEAHRVGARRFEGIVMGGLDDAGFSPSSRGDAMGELLAHLAPIPPGDRALKERLIFYNAVTRARSRLVLVRKSSDSDGRIVRPSPFWDEMLDFYRDPALGPGVPEQVAADSVMAADASAASPAFGRGRADLRRAIAEGADAPSIPAPAERGRLTDEAILTELAARDLFSATELEKYVRCPYRWFYERTVRPEPLDGERGPMESGRLIHEVLREFYAGALREATGSGRVTHGNLDHALEVVDAVLDAEIARSDARVPVSLAEEDEVATARARCRGLVMADADFLPGTEPWKVEWAFGGDDHPVAITDFGIHGRVDRVDRGSGTVAVMDYKRGKVPTGAEIKDGRSLQVMLYAYAVRRVLGERVTHGFYRGLAASTDLAVAPEDTFIAKDSDGGSVEMTYLDAALDAAVAAVAGIRAGRIPADPKSGACSFCGAAATCPRRPQ
jgi:RecB family exonuclease